MAEKDFEYDPTGFTLREAIIEAKRCLHCVKPQCRKGCPIENEIPEFIGELANGNLGAASAVIARRSNLPAVCGRVCPHEKQCEGACILNKTGRGIKIGKLERFVADMDGEFEITPLPKTSEVKGKVAIVGSGPAGLTVAGDLAKKGYEVTVFDGQKEAGGVLMYGIPEFRLPKDVVRREIKKIEKLGVEFKLSSMIGTEVTLDDILNQGYDAVFVGTGNSVSKSLQIEGSLITGVLQAAYLLEMVALAAQGSVDAAEVPVRAGDQVVIIGAGNTAMDAARTAMREKAASVTVLNRSREEEIAAWPAEVELAKEEGVKVLSLLAPQRFLGNEHVIGVECVEREIAGDGSVVDTARTTVIPADKVIIAVGQKPARRIIGSTKGIQVDENGFVKVKERPYGMTTRHGIFSGGDVVHGPATVVRAMKNAKKVSLGIEQYVEAKKLMEECGLQMPKA
ncbi:MAG: NAD(P)-dependent oxidoreductase [Selenomonadaceae bacterium]